MTEGLADTTTVARSAGALLREARQAQGMHIAALAALIKVAQRKLEALEADRFDELPDATFTRALAQTVCRALKIDAAPVLALLPGPAGYRLEQVGEGINAPFRDRPGRHEPSDWSMLASPAVWGPLLLLAAAAVVYLMPAGWLTGLQPAPVASSPTGAPVAVESAASASAPAVVLMPPAPVIDAASPSVGEVASAPANVAAPMATASAPTAAPTQATGSDSARSGSGSLQVRTKAQSWIEVQDARSKVLLARMLQAGEIVALDGQAPLRLKIGNAGATDVIFRGQPVDLAPSTRDNVARLELK
jgi:cytoskeleton protein RodZ